ncbi:MAG: ATP-binding protein [Sedimentisphaerales bacterium]|jgi:hypothetical protein
MNLIEIWDSIRGVIIDSFTFNNIKEIAGASGLPIHKLSHLQQRSFPTKGASKSELLDAINDLLNEQQDPNRIIKFFIQEMLRRRSMIEGRVNEVINRFGWKIQNGDIFAQDAEKAELVRTKQKNEQTITQIIAQGEGHTVEFKETLEYDVKTNNNSKDVLLSSLKTIAGFLNSNGGTLLIGVNDSGEIKGIERDLSTMKHGTSDRFEQRIRNCIRDRFSPQPIGKVKISFEEFTEGTIGKFTEVTICCVNVPANKDVIHLDDYVYVRDGNTTQKLEGRNLTDWIQQRGE